MADVDSYVVKYIDQKGLYYIKSTRGKPVPEKLKGLWTRKPMAEKVMRQWVEEQTANGPSKGKQTVQSVRKRVDN